MFFVLNEAVNLTLIMHAPRRPSLTERVESALQKLWGGGGADSTSGIASLCVARVALNHRLVEFRSVGGEKMVWSLVGTVVYVYIL